MPQMSWLTVARPLYRGSCRHEERVGVRTGILESEGRGWSREGSDDARRRGTCDEEVMMVTASDRSQVPCCLPHGDDRRS